MHIAKLLFSAIGTGCLAACASLKFDGPTRAGTQEEAGSVHVAVLSVGRWDDYKAALQPKFGVKSSDALNMALTPTRTLEDSVLDALRFAAAVSGESQTTTTSTSTETATDGTVTSAGTQSSETKPISASPPTVPTANPLPTELRAVVPSGAPPPAEAVLRYQNANAIFQEIQLLDRYVLDASKRKGWTPYVVRLQLTVLPTARRRPYDVYANVTFQSVPGTADRNAPPVVVPFRNTKSLDDVNNEVKKQIAGEDRIVVVPLIATDQLESTTHARQLDQIRQLAISLALLQGNVGAGVEVQKFSERVSRAFGRDVNSLLSVGRLTDDTIRVRLGAMQGVDTEYSLIPRTHNVTLLILSEADDSQERRVNAYLQSEFRDVSSGLALPTRSHKQVIAAAHNILGQFDPKASSTAKDEAVFELVLSAQSEALHEFAVRLKSLNSPLLAGVPAQVQLALKGLLVGSQYSSTQFEFPAKPSFAADLSSKRVSALMDDGKKSTLQIAIDPQSGRLSAVALASAALVVDGANLLPSAVAIDAELQRATLTFPSPTQLKLKTDQPVQFWNASTKVVKVPEPEKKAAGVAISTGASMVWADELRAGTVALSVVFAEQDPAPALTISVSGADVESVACNTSCVQTTGKIMASNDGILKLKLRNLGSSIAIKGQGAKGSSPIELSIPVVQLPPKIEASVQ